ncbi:MAG: hypothetical protein KF841_05345 [Phycisphaerae bacterium]|nr:hypothetical protein [Phycisphaerae bacterium]
MRRRLISAALGAVACYGGCGFDGIATLPAPLARVCLDFSASGFPADWQQIVYNHMVVDFSDYGYRVTFHDLDTCDYRIILGGDDERYWGLARPAERVAWVYTDAIAKWAQHLDANAYLQGVANATAHEFGHLIGRSHSDDSTDVMSVPEDATVRFHEDLVFRP